MHGRRSPELSTRLRYVERIRIQRRARCDALGAEQNSDHGHAADAELVAPEDALRPDLGAAPALVGRLRRSLREARAGPVMAGPADPGPTIRYSHRYSHGMRRGAAVRGSTCGELAGEEGFEPSIP